MLKEKYTVHLNKDLPTPVDNNYHGLLKWRMENSTAEHNDEHNGLLQEFYLAPRYGAESTWPHKKRSLYEREFTSLNCLRSHRNRRRSPKAPSSDIILARAMKTESAAAHLHSNSEFIASSITELTANMSDSKDSSKERDPTGEKSMCKDLFSDISPALVHFFLD